MRALRFTEWGKTPQLTEVPVPVPGPGEVVLKVEVAGACHSDLHLMDWPAGMLAWRLPFTLGHEVAGHVSGVGSGVTGWKEGDTAVVYGPWGCGSCRSCRLGQENYCERAADLPGAGVGLGYDGGMADYVLVPHSRLLLSADGLDLTQAAPLTDAALTPYHAVKLVSEALVPGSAVVVVGVGGLGHAAIQILRALTPATVIAVDTDATKLELAAEVGAHHTFLAADSEVTRIRTLTGGGGVEAVLDFVGADQSMALAAKVVRAQARIVVVGLAQGTLPFSFFALPYEAAIMSSYWGSSVELQEVLDLARSDLIHVETEEFSLEDALEAYDRLRQGRVRGRAVVVPSREPKVLTMTARTPAGAAR